MTSDAGLAAAIFAFDPMAIGGVLLRGGPGPERDAWLETVKALASERRMRRVPSNIQDDRLIGGLDLALTLAEGRPVVDRGLLAETDGGICVFSTAERMPTGTAARIGAAMDLRSVTISRDGVDLRLPASFGVVALDEGREEEATPAALADRLAIHLTLEGPVSERNDQVELFRSCIDAAVDEPEVIEALSGASLALGIGSLRAPILALRVARASAALGGRIRIADEDIAVAARLVLAPRATRIPSLPSDQEPQPPEPLKDAQGGEREAELPDDLSSSKPPADALRDIVIASAAAALPANLLASLGVMSAQRVKGSTSGKAGAERQQKARGKVIGTRIGDLRGGARLAILATLRNAAPWQRVRKAKPGHIAVRKEDFRLLRFRQRSETTTIFVVDASGSAALHRLAEAKGAVELLLGDCYARRDRVALIAFRGRFADVVLPPTRSLTRARRALSGLPGGGGTPLATALDVAAILATSERRAGRSPAIIMLTDGRANIARDGSHGRVQAEEDGLDAAKRLRLIDVPCLLVDTAQRPQEFCRRIADIAGAKLIVLPTLGSANFSIAVRAVHS